MNHTRLIIFYRLCLAIFVLYTFNACEKKYDFTRINDGDDWQFKDEFTTKEKQLFDSLDFTKTAEFVEEQSPEISISHKGILFYPNPLTAVGSFEYPYKTHILNFVLVDEDFNKMLIYRASARRVSFDFSGFNDGYYRLYYVVQDSSYNIVHLGHGDIKKETKN